MKRALLALCASGAVSSPVFPDTAKESWKTEMEERLDQLEQGLQQQTGELEEKDRHLEKLQAQQEMTSHEADKTWFQDVELAGLIEVEASSVSAEEGEDSSDINVATVELGIISQVNDWVGAEILLLYEEDSDNNGDLNIDTALITLADPAGNWFLKAGRSTLPFGVYATQMISDPITLELGETDDTAVEFGYHRRGLSASLFVFQGDQSDKVDSVGAQLGFGAEVDGLVYDINLGYLNNLAESNLIVDGAWVTDNDKIPAWTLSAVMTRGGWTLIGEYLSATGEFVDAGGEQPSAFNLEAAYGFEVVSKPASLALGYQASDDAANDNWGLPEKRLVGSFSMELLAGTRLGVEYRRDQDYASANTDTLTGQLAVEF
jgi:hypothetical protein